MLQNHPMLLRWEKQSSARWRHAAFVLWCVICCLSLGACSGKPPTPTVTDARKNAQEPDQTPERPTNITIRQADDGSATYGRVPQETWDAIYMGDAKVGYAHTTTTPISENAQDLVQIASQTETTLKRFGDSTTVRLTLVSVETPDGRLVRFRSEQANGPAVMVTRGRVEMDRLVLVTQSLGKTVETAIPWNKSWGGFFAFEQSLLQRPMRPGEQRTVRGLLPVFHQVADMQLEATDYEDTPMLTGTRELLKINSLIKLDAGQIEQHLWTDRSGEVLKSLMPGIGQVTYRTSKEVSLGEGAEFDLGTMSLVAVARRLDRPHETRRIVYRAHVKDGNLSSVFATGSTQSVRTIDRATVEVTVRAITPGQPERLESPDVRPVEDDVEPNNLIQSDDQLVGSMAAAIAPGETDPWSIAKQLERHVRSIIREINFTQAFATAAEVAQSREGDCTEHAVLLAALCRARQIPARVAIGLVYSLGEMGPGLAYHMWTEVWITDRWVPLDATLGRGGIGAAHLKLTSSNLHGASAYSAFLPVMDMIGRLELEIVKAE